MQLFNIYIKHTDGSMTQHLNIEADRVPQLLAAVSWSTATEYRIAKIADRPASES